jgi:hypothetical protein
MAKTTDIGEGYSAFLIENTRGSHDAAIWKAHYDDGSSDSFHIGEGGGTSQFQGKVANTDGLKNM